MATGVRGKSSLLNALTRQQSSIVSDTPGTTTDPVEKPMELPLLGPVQFIDTAGVDDEGMLGEQRMERTRQVFDRCDIGIIVTAADQPGGVLSHFEQRSLEEFQRRSIPVILVLNKIDLCTTEALQDLNLPALPWVFVDALRGRGLAELRAALVKAMPEDFLTPPPIVSDLMPPGEMALLVVPIDQAAPKGRLILPQVQTIRDLLDAGQSCVVIQDHQVAETLARIQLPPAIVVTDSQAFAHVSQNVPPDIPLTSFSILFARQKGDLALLADGAKTIADLKPGDRVVIAEACTHHPTGEDIGTVKIPAMLQKYLKQQYADGELEIRHVRGHDLPDSLLAETDLVIHCGGCMWNRREMLSRLLRCRAAGVPITNYGLAIAFMLGILDRALKPLLAC